MLITFDLEKKTIGTAIIDKFKYILKLLYLSLSRERVNYKISDYYNTDLQQFC